MINIGQIPPITKNLLILNIVVFVIQQVMPEFNENFALHFFKSPEFEPYQLLTHMFMHGGISHLIFNMFGLFMFGKALEMRLGDKKFLIYYLLTGFGAVLLHQAVNYLEFFDQIIDIEYRFKMMELHPVQQINFYREHTGVALGASGAIFGILAGFALFYPNQPLYLMFIPVPIKAKFFVIFYAAYELYAGLNFAGDGVAHFAHLGGALFGWLIIKEWRKKHLI